MVAAASSATEKKPPHKAQLSVKKKGKKRKVSKHIAEAAAVATKTKDERALPVQDMPEAAAAALVKAPAAAKKKRKKVHFKDPSKAAAYLTAWKTNKVTNNSWKFNKNTQSWLIRHMYDADKIPKTVFADLMEYLVAAGDTTKERIAQGATRRALRYQQYTSGTVVENETNGTTTNEGATATENDDADDRAVDANDDDDDATRWKNLNDHDKRKEYKRARKVLETLAVASTKSS